MKLNSKHQAYRCSLFAVSLLAMLLCPVGLRSAGAGPLPDVRVPNIGSTMESTSGEGGMIQLVEPYEQSLTRWAETPRNRVPWDTRPIPSAKGANRSTR